MRFTIRQCHNLKVIEYLDREIFNGEKGIDEEASWWVVYSVEGGEDLDQCQIMTPVGFAGAKILPREPYAYLTKAGLLPEAQGHGLHKRLIQVRLAWARKLHLRGAMTYTAAHNVASSNNLIKCGFSLFTPGYPWAGEEFLYWWTKL